MIHFTAQEREDNATDTENAIGSVSPGLLGTCGTCQFDYGETPRAFYSKVHTTGEIIDEGSFSLYECELCGSHLGGDRFAAHAYHAENGITHLEVCHDCDNSLAYGIPYPSEYSPDDCNGDTYAGLADDATLMKAES